MADETHPEPDRAEGTPHPRRTAAVFGHDRAKATLADALGSGRMHHAWLFAGPPGIGKATLAYAFARALISGAPSGGLLDAPPPTLDLSPDHPVARRIAALSEPRLLLIRRAWDDDRKRLKTVITVDETRRLSSFFHLSATDGGRRVVIVDPADEMNESAANALLKLLEEPPRDAVLILISHAPSRLLPTIRSRCRELRLFPLGADALDAAVTAAGLPPSEDPAALAELAQGSVGEAARLAADDGVALYAEIAALLSGAPGLDRPRALRLADAAGQRGAETRRDLTIRLIRLALARLARHGAGAPPAAEAAPGEARLLARLSPDPHAARAWAGLHETLSARTGHALAVNLDPSSVVLDMLLKIDDTAASLTRSPVP